MKNIFNNLLFVEDEEFLIETIENFAKKMNAKNFYTAKNGKEALAILEKHHQNINIISTDINMPIMNGYKLIEECNLSYPEKTIIVISGNSTPEHDQKLKDLEVEYIISKPLDLVKFIEKLKIIRGVV